MLEIRKIYQRWLDGGLAQEDALFAIGDVLSGSESLDGLGYEAEGQPLRARVADKEQVR